MRESFLFGTLEKQRAYLLLLVEKCPIEKRNVVPAGFNNSIQWQIGHILTITDDLVFVYSGEESRVPAEFQSLFGSRTKPADWTEEPPAWEAIIEQLKEQPQQIREAFSGKMEAQVKGNFAKAEVFVELFIANINHECNHTGSINAMLKVLS